MRSVCGEVVFVVVRQAVMILIHTRRFLRLEPNVKLYTREIATEATNGAADRTTEPTARRELQNKMLIDSRHKMPSLIATQT